MLNICLHMLCKDSCIHVVNAMYFVRLKYSFCLVYFSDTIIHIHTHQKKTPNTCSSLDKQEFYFILSLVHIDSNVNYYACGVQRLKFDPFILGHEEVAFVVRMKLVH